MNAAILGAGVDGLLAAHACVAAGLQPTVFSRKVKTKLGGAQYLDRPVPDLNNATNPDTIIFHRVAGDELGYRRKVYGPGDDVVEESEFVEVYNGMREPAWSLRRAYNRLWDMWEEEIVDKEITANFVRKVREDFDLVFSTVPLMSICSHRNGNFHNFYLRQSLIAPVMLEKLVGDCVLWDGTKNRSWFRMSLVFGEAATEWATGAPVPTMDKLMKITTPISSDCDCWPDIVRVGRNGAWSRKEQTSEVFAKVIGAIESRR